MPENETLPLAAETPAVPEAEAKFDQAAQWGADSESHEPTEAGNDSHGDIDASASDARDAASQPETPLPAVVEETPRNDAGQFVKKGKGKPRSDPQARVEAATAKEAAAKEEARQAREEAAQLKVRLAALEQARSVAETRPAHGISSQPGPAAQLTPREFPTFDEWSKGKSNPEWDAYNRELIRHEATEQARTIAAQQIQTWQQQQAFQAQAQTYQQRVTEGAKQFPDYEQVLTQGDQAIMPRLAQYGMTEFPPIFRAALLDSQRPADILRDLALHPEDAIQLAVEWHDAPVSAARSFRTVLESRLAPTAVPSPDSAPAAPISTAKPPINRVGGSASATPVEPEDMDFGPEYIRAENERERKRQAMGRW